MQLGGVVDVDATSLTIDQLQNAFKDQGKGKDVALCMPRSRKFANDYSQDFWAGAFFDLYPWCEGTVADKRDVRLSPTEYAQHVMNIADPRFRQHAVFPFALFNVTQRHQVLSSTSQSLRMGMLLEMRKHLAWYVKGMPGAARFRTAAGCLTTASEVAAALQAFFGAYQGKPEDAVTMNPCSGNCS